MVKKSVASLAFSVFACGCVVQPAEAYTVISKWPQENLGDPVRLTYSFSNLFDGQLLDSTGTPLSESELRTGVEEAMELWATYAPLVFTEVVDNGSGQPYDFATEGDIRFGHHAIDGPGAFKAHAYFPPFGALAGDVHFDTDDRWNLVGTGTFPDILGASIHELGHSLGLGHSKERNANMWPGFPRMNGPGTGYLSPDDIAGIRAIYGYTKRASIAMSPAQIYSVIDRDSGSGLDGLGDITIDRRSRPRGFIGEVDRESTNRIGRLVAKFVLPRTLDVTRDLESATLRVFLTELDGSPAGAVSLLHSTTNNNAQFPEASEFEDETYRDTDRDLVGPTDEAGRYYELDVTDLVLADYAEDGDDPVSAFRLQITAADFFEDDLSARYLFTMPGAEANHPELVLNLIPEPATIALFAIGLFGFSGYWRDEKRAARRG